MNIKPIETSYKGYRFRSRLEARWAVFFDGLRVVTWEYEKEGYVLEDGTYYLPDFWFPFDKDNYFSGKGAFVEIKPNSPSIEERSKLELLNKGTEHTVMCFWGIPDPNDFHATIYKNGKCQMVDGMYSDQYQCLYTADGNRIHCLIYNFLWLMTPDFFKRSLVNDASNAAKSARFEYGEKG